MIRAGLKKCTGSRIERPAGYNCGGGALNVTCIGNCGGFFGLNATTGGSCSGEDCLVTGTRTRIYIASLDFSIFNDVLSIEIEAFINRTLADIFIELVRQGFTSTNKKVKRERCKVAKADLAADNRENMAVLGDAVLDFPNRLPQSEVDLFYTWQAHRKTKSIKKRVAKHCGG